MALATPMILAAVVLLNLKITDNVGYKPIQRVNEIRKNIEDDRLAKIKAAQQAAEARAALETIQVQNPVKMPVKTFSETISGCGDNQWANFIYMHESGCRLNSTNAGGCVGIGQACPGSKLYAVCPDLNYACQNSFFTAYANNTYGGWAGAYNAWLSKGWW